MTVDPSLATGLIADCRLPACGRIHRPDRTFTSTKPSRCFRARRALLRAAITGKKLMEWTSTPKCSRSITASF